MRAFYAEQFRCYLYRSTVTGDDVCWFDPVNPRLPRFAATEDGLPIVDVLPADVVQVGPLTGDPHPIWFERADFDDTTGRVSWWATDVEHVTTGEIVGWVGVWDADTAPADTLDLGDPLDVVTKTTQQLNRNFTRGVETETGRPRDSLQGMTRMELMHTICRENVWDISLNGVPVAVFDGGVS